MEIKKRRTFIVCLSMSIIIGMSSVSIPVLAMDNKKIEINSARKGVPGYYTCTGTDVNIRSVPGGIYYNIISEYGGGTVNRATGNYTP